MKKPWVTTKDGQRRIRTFGGIVHLVNMKARANDPNTYTERGRSICGMYLRAAHGEWVDPDVPITCIHCLSVEEPVVPQTRWKQVRRR